VRIPCIGSAQSCFSSVNVSKSMPHSSTSVFRLSPLSDADFVESENDLSDLSDSPSHVMNDLLQQVSSLAESVKYLESDSDELRNKTDSFRRNMQIMQRHMEDQTYVINNMTREIQAMRDQIGPPPPAKAPPSSHHTITNKAHPPQPAATNKAPPSFPSEAQWKRCKVQSVT
jgi:hypothetical protein